MTVEWNSYDPYVPPVLGPLHELPRKLALEAYEHLMLSKRERLEKLRGLLEANGVEWGRDNAAIQRLNDWFRGNVECAGDNPNRLRNIWYAVVNDVALLLGDIIIERSPRVHWEMFIAGKRDVAYQRHVLVGFTKAPNPRFNVDIDRLVATYASQVASGLPVSPDYFVTTVRAAVSKA
ncbi:MAG TPA: hypothetical protein VFT01_00495 [Homoserinimonas sp.]|nr:hypothetical protein [Homoserinimonas sp.]